MFTELSLAIQAGGQSLRMGEDKALKPFLGRPLISWVVERARSLTLNQFVVTNEPDRYGFLELPLFSDLLPGYGSLGGLYTAIEKARTPLLAVAGCDMPFINPKLFWYQADILASHENLAAVIPQSQGQHFEMFHGVYRPSLCRKPVKAALQAGHRRMISWLYAVELEIILPQTVSQFDPNHLAFWNLNTPAEFQQAESLAATFFNDPTKNKYSSPPDP